MGGMSVSSERVATGPSAHTGDTASHGTAPGVSQRRTWGRASKAYNPRSRSSVAMADGCRATEPPAPAVAWAARVAAVTPSGQRRACRCLSKPQGTKRGPAIPRRCFQNCLLPGSRPRPAPPCGTPHPPRWLRPRPLRRTGRASRAPGPAPQAISPVTHAEHGPGRLSPLPAAGRVLRRQRPSC